MSETTGGTKEKLHLEYHLPAESFLLNAALTFSIRSLETSAGGFCSWCRHRKKETSESSSAAASQWLLCLISQSARRGGGASLHKLQQTQRNIIRSQQTKQQQQKSDLYLDGATNKPSQR